MKTGRPPKPTHLKLVTGTQRKSRVNEAEPKAPAGSVRMPAHLRPYAKEKWRELAPLLKRMNVLTPADAGALALLCSAYADMREAQDAYARPIVIRRRVPGSTPGGEPLFEEVVVAEANEPTYVTDGRSGPMVRARPEVRMIAAAEKRLAEHGGRFGLDPSTRARISAAPDAGKSDPASKYFD